MKPQDVLLELQTENDYYMRYFLTDAKPDCLHWRVDAESNTIAILIWHVVRVQDVFYTLHILNESAENQVWFSDAYHTKTGYDPRGIGVNGWGMLSNFTPAEVNAIPPFEASVLLDYYDALHTRIQTYLQETDIDTLLAPALGFEGKQTNWFWVRHPLFDMSRHIGEMLAIEGLYQRAHPEES